jgi:hypothetical protein
MSTKKIIAGLVVVAILGFGYYAISPLFVHIHVDEALPQTTEIKVNTQAQPTDAAAAPSISTATSVTGTTGHPASGTARVVRADGKTYVRYENFKTIDGPDIYVYLAKDLDAKEFINLGKVRATEGNINYEIPAGVSISDYPYVLTWCKTFGVLFNSAKLN